MAAATASSAAETAIGRDARMRRVAILLSSLPGPVAAKLLGSIDPASKQSLRRTMTTLSDVDPKERHRVIESFRVSIGRQSEDRYTAVSEGGDTFESSASSAGQRANPSSASNRHGTGSPASPILKNAFPENVSSEDHSESSSPLAFLGNVEDEALSDILKDEHPQAVALVLASVPPQKAGRVLPLLPDQLRSQALSRIGRLGDIPEEAAADLASHFQSRIGQVASAKSTSTGQRKLDAILASMPTASKPSQDSAVEETQARSAITTQRSDADVSAIELSHRLRVVSDDSPAIPPQVVSETQEVARSASVATSSPQTAFTASLDSTDAIHARLLSLTPKQLCQSLARVETREAMLCLCGLPNPVAEAALGLLPKDQAKKVREQINGLSSLNLRDIDSAKEGVANASMMFAAKSSSASQPSAMAA